jgi:hypothetical protein
MAKQRIIGSDAKPELWNRLKRKHTCDVKDYYWLIEVELLFGIDEVTELREGGDVRGRP